EDGQLEYRGQDAIALSDKATLEDVAALLWQVDALPSQSPGLTWPRARSAPGRAESCIGLMAELAMAGRWAGRVESVLPDALRVLDRVAWAAAGHSGSRVLASSAPLHERLATAWGVGPKAADMIRRVLVLLADHELNA